MSKSAALLNAPSHALARDLSPRGVLLRGSLSVALTAFGDAHLFADLDGTVRGVFVPTYRPFAVGDEVRLAIELPEEDLEVRGTVAWIRDATDDAPPGVGVALDGIDDEARVVLERFARVVPPWYY